MLKWLTPTPEQQVIVALKMPEGATVEHAINASGLLNHFPEIDWADIRLVFLAAFASSISC